VVNDHSRSTPSDTSMKRKSAAEEQLPIRGRLTDH
jgi:hypothetical protein